ncbi:MAG TPA: hypothetical protein VMY77_06995 [Chitinophagaceae bacterium]|nr:hypothetical protein [Chitinophagaceae bacterium]
MNKNNIVIDMTEIVINDLQRKKLHKALHTTVIKQLKKIKTGKPRKSELRMRSDTQNAPVVQLKTANLDVGFTNTNPGQSNLTAILNEQEHTITESGTIIFTNVQRGDIIIVQGESLGLTTVTIDIDADPAQMNFKPGHFNKNFFVN